MMTGGSQSRLNSTILLEHYRSMGRLTRQMLGAARDGKWDYLLELDQARGVLEADLRQHDSVKWEGPAATEMAQLVQDILTATTEVATLAAAQMAALQSTLAQASLAVKVNQAYTAT